MNLYRRYIETQERNGKINRQLEFLPDDKVLTERRLAGKGLTRPEIAVLLAYSKIILKNDVLHSDLTKDSGLNHYVEYAFPQRLRKQYAAEMLNHRLYPEIVATQLSNALVTDMGIAFVYQMEDETGASMPNIMRAYVATKQIFDMSTSQKDIYSLDYKVNPDLQLEMMLEIMRLVRRGVRWFLRNRHHPMDVKLTTEQFAPLVTDLYKRLPELLVGTEKADLEAKIQELTTAEVPLKVASRIASSRYIYSALNIIQAATDYHFPINEVAAIYFTLANRLELVWFRECGGR